MDDGAPTALEWLLAMGAGDGYAPTRHQRYDIELPLRYRVRGETTWHQGRTEDISHTGVFFRGELLMQVDTQVEISFEVALETGSETLAEIVLQGEILRMVLPDTLDTAPGFAARIRRLRLVQPITAPVV